MVSIKSEDVISSIENGDFSVFKEMVPTAISAEFFNLQKELEFFKK